MSMNHVVARHDPRHGAHKGKVSGSEHQASALTAPPMLRSRKALARVSFATLAVLVDAAAIIGASVAADVGYNMLRHGGTDIFYANIQVGLFAAVLFVLLNVARNRYSVSDFLDMTGHVQRTAGQWMMAFLAAAAFGFLARSMDDSSRGAFLIFGLAGLFALYAARAALTIFVRRHASNDGVLADRVIIVGFAGEIEALLRDHNLSNQGVTVVGTQVLREADRHFANDLAAASRLARTLVPDDIFVVVPWTRTDVIEACVTAFMRVPCSLHLVVDPNSPLTRFSAAQMDKKGTIPSLRLKGYSMSMTGSIMKRLFDIVASALALILLAPLFMLVVVAIRLESRGPAFFFQSRHGYNKVPFRILKFRSMKTMEDGAAVRQVTAGDPRITRVGRLLRKFNIDELPQLVNVLRGEMSLVGPRPHAMVHDQQFEPEIELYARRHNVRPGITGWAQVNGLRGETNTPEKISKRVQYDLFYVDHWSFMFDIWIMFLTVFSKRAYLNAA